MAVIRKISGGNLAGGNPARGRVKNDFYATKASDTHAFLNQLEQDGFSLDNQSILEPAAGMGHITDVLLERTKNTTVDSYDIEPLRGDVAYNDYLNNKIDKKYDVVFTNPPFKFAKEFIDQSLLIADKVFIFAKIQFLEGVARKEWFKTLPLQYVYVYSFRAHHYEMAKKLMRMERNGQAQCVLHGLFSIKDIKESQLLDGSN